MRKNMRKAAIFLIILSLPICLAYAGSAITIKGSDTLVRLGQRWAEEYMKLNPGVTIQVSGGGSGVGIAALISDGTDICEASRDMKDQEYKTAEAKGIKPYRVAVALDGIAVFLNELNPIKEIALDQLKRIYTGALTNWKEIGGPDHSIVLYGRENNSGTYAFFKEHVLKDENYAEQTQTLPGTAAVANAVAKDQFGIGYGGLAWATGVKNAAVKRTDTSQAILPSVETVSNGTYPISRELYWFFNGVPNREIKKLLNWVLSGEGRQIAQDIDYVPLPGEMAEKNMIK
jgi:phosphate transport system substrate-binding protein